MKLTSKQIKAVAYELAEESRVKYNSEQTKFLASKSIKQEIKRMQSEVKKIPADVAQILRIQNQLISDQNLGNQLWYDYVRTGAVVLNNEAYYEHLLSLHSIDAKDLKDLMKQIRKLAK